MTPENDIPSVLDRLILSASGWRGVFAIDLDEESKKTEIIEAHKIICGAAALSFAEYLKSPNSRPQILLATDTRPTGKAIINAMLPVLLASGCDVFYAGVCTAPEIMAWARNEKAVRQEFSGFNDSLIPIGFIYISASHNPIGYNGIKFGLADGGVLAPEENIKLIDYFRSFFENENCAKIIEELTSSVTEEQIELLYAVSEVSKAESLRAYYEFSAGTAFLSGDSAVNKDSSDDPSFIMAVSSIVNKNIGIACDFNGSARTVSIDKDFFDSFGLKFESINNEAGQIVHRIVPEGESLEPCREFLEQLHARDPSFLIGYTPDCDGDRGNLVIWDDSLNKARILEAQEVFALACLSEFAYQIWIEKTQGSEFPKKAVVVNDPTSLRIDRIAEAFNIEVFCAEVGEANVVSLARSLREQGYTVRILGEGSAGGNITHPSAVRDPLHTVMALIKLLAIREQPNSSSGGLFGIWCKASGQTGKYKDDFSFADIIGSLPDFVTTGVYEEDAILRINTKDHAVLKEKYQKIFLREWEDRKDDLKNRLGICKWEAIAYNGQEEKRGLTCFGEAGRGGLKILFYGEKDMPVAFIWMRGSSTEPVFRIMADIEGADKEKERLLLNWQRDMIIEADTNRQ